MKKLIILFSAAIALVACAKVESEKQEVNPSTPVTFNVKVASTDTKAAAKSDWANGDVIYLVFKGITTKYLSLTYNSGKWNVSSSFVASDFSGLGGDYEFTAVHFPITVTPSLSAGTLSFTADEKPVYTYYMKEVDAEYEFDGTAVSMTVNLTKAAGYVQFHVPGIESGIANYSFAANDVQPVACSSIDASTGAIAEVSKNVGAAFGGFLDADGAVFSAKVTKSGTEQAYTFMLTSTYNPLTPTYNYTFTKTRVLDAGTFYKFKATSDASWTPITIESNSYVDLGLPSGLKWATCNMDASVATGHGKYYAWGELTGYTPDVHTFSRSNNRFAGATSGWTKYSLVASDGYDGVFIDGKEILEAVDDAATYRLGTGYRIPTKAEWLELISECTWTWYENYNDSGTTGVLVTGPNDNTIFFPADGVAIDSSTSIIGLNSGFRYLASQVTYNELSPSANYLARVMGDYNTERTKPKVSGYYRYWGWSIRPVHD